MIILREEGHPIPGLTDLMKGLAYGGVGLIITGHTFVQKQGRATPFQLALDSDESLSGVSRREIESEEQEAYFSREPDLVNRWKNGDCRKSACISDNLCFKPTLTGKGLSCVSERRKG